MKNRCEICGSSFGLEEVYACVCDEESPSATLCKKCKKKYFDYMLPGPSGIFGPIPSVQYIPWLDYASNLVYAYNERYGNSDKDDKKEATMQVTYNGFTGELVRLSKNSPFNDLYDLIIDCSDRDAVASFSGVKLEDVKFLGGAVTFGG